ncbi:nuclear transport factor 2 family protein [Roseibium aggregatum]|uniref:Nuclear transport factor 2 family protein n=1 Tax=Roseibium aggregatum TaxID=187304 RepID=A0A939EKB4_9HYPH|nr:nuclear transport factor 2 family protein [Roseibium aggregatum]MBN9673898.1 nuclear transport factor 2 family protein [Roseibium aggregatum]
MSDIDRIVSAFYSAYNAHDAHAATELYTSGGWHEEIAMGGRRAGHEALRAGLEGLFRMLSDVRWQERQRIRSAESVVVSYEMTGTFTPKPKENDARPAPRSVRLPGVHVFEFSDGHLQGTRDYWDKSLFLSQIA